MAYPTSIDSFTAPTGTSLLTSPDHAGLHGSSGSAITAVETVLGTTGGTSVLMNFVAGNFPARINASNVLQQSLTGTLTASHVGGTANFTAGTISGNLMGTNQYTGGTSTAVHSVTRTIGSAVYPGTVSTTITLNLALATRHLVNMPNSAGSVTLALSNVSANQPFLVEIMQGTAGLGTVNFFSTIRWAGSAAPTQTLTASRKDTFGFMPTGTSTFDGYIVGQNI
jgi:hypothetical protein